MFNTYADIFNNRGAAYHESMQRFPTARDEEFEAMIRLLGPKDGQVIVDMPSGGGYMRRYFGESDIQLIAVETTPAFHSQCVEDHRTRCLLCDLQDTGLAPESIDSIASMAGLHHAEDRLAVFREMYRILKPGGRLCIADVEKGSVIDGFLNTFVDQHNSMGHDGHFIDDHFRRVLEEAQFTIESDELIKYEWKFDKFDHMIEFCTLMFGLDKSTPEQVEEGIRSYQGYKRTDTSCNMNWELRFICCTKPEIDD